MFCSDLCTSYKCFYVDTMKTWNCIQVLVLLVYFVHIISALEVPLKQACEMYLQLARPFRDPNRSRLFSNCEEACTSPSAILPAALNRPEVTLFCVEICKVSSLSKSMSGFEWPPSACDAQPLSSLASSTNLAIQATTYSAVFGFCEKLYELGQLLPLTYTCFEKLLLARPQSPRVLLALAFSSIANGFASLTEHFGLQGLRVTLELAKLRNVRVSEIEGRLPPSANATTALLLIGSREMEFSTDSAREAATNIFKSSWPLPSRPSSSSSTAKIQPWADVEPNGYDRFLTQAHFAYSWALFDQNKWQQMLPIAETRMIRESQMIDPPYFQFVLQSAQQLVDMPRLERWESFGEMVLDHMLNPPDSEVNIHPFSALSWGFMTTALQKTLSRSVALFYERRCGARFDWSTTGATRQQLLSSLNLSSSPASQASKSSESTSRIRIGYLAYHFRIEHPIGSLMEATLASHNRSRFEVFCYALKRPVKRNLEEPFHRHCEHFIPCYRDDEGVNGIPYGHIDASRLPADPSRWLCKSESSTDLMAQLRHDGIQIAVDLDGFMELRPNRLGALCARPAPIQVNYLGFPGSMAEPSSFMQYSIVDGVISPPARIAAKAHLNEFWEKLVRLPFTYLPTSHRYHYAQSALATQGLHVRVWREKMLQLVSASQWQTSIVGADLEQAVHFEHELRQTHADFESQSAQYRQRFVGLPNSAMAELAALRRRFELPSDRFLFASFNMLKKIGPHSLAAWMQILLRAPHAALVLMDPVKKSSDNSKREDESVRANAQAIKDNILAYANRTGVDSHRIIFAPRVPAFEDHLLRLSAMDLILDTFPYGAHTTAADAIWAGVPVLTWPFQKPSSSSKTKTDGKQYRMAGRVAASLLFASSCLTRVSGLQSRERVDEMSEEELALYRAYENRIREEHDHHWHVDDSRFAAVKYESQVSLKTHSESAASTIKQEQISSLLLESLDTRIALAFRPSSSVPAFQGSAVSQSTSPHVDSNRLIDQIDRLHIFPYFRPNSLASATLSDSPSLPHHVLDFSSLSNSPHGRMIAFSRQHYIDLAVFFAHHSRARLTWRTCFERERWRSPLFDAAQHTRDLERAYSEMWQQWVNGEDPQDINLPVETGVTDSSTSSSLTFSSAMLTSKKLKVDESVVLETQYSVSDFEANEVVTSVLQQRINPSQYSVLSSALEVPTATASTVSSSASSILEVEVPTSGPSSVSTRPELIEDAELIDDRMFKDSAFLQYNRSLFEPYFRLGNWSTSNQVPNPLHTLLYFSAQSLSSSSSSSSCFSLAQLNEILPVWIADVLLASPRSNGNWSSLVLAICIQESRSDVNERQLELLFQTGIQIIAAQVPSSDRLATGAENIEFPAWLSPQRTEILTLFGFDNQPPGLLRFAHSVAKQAKWSLLLFVVPLWKFEFETNSSSQLSSSDSTSSAPTRNVTGPVGIHLPHDIEAALMLYHYMAPRGALGWLFPSSLPLLEESSHFLQNLPSFVNASLASLSQSSTIQTLFQIPDEYLSTVYVDLSSVFLLAP